MVYVEVLGLPGIQQHWGLGIGPVAGQETVQEQPVQRATHATEAIGGAGQHYLGGVELTS